MDAAIVALGFRREACRVNNCVASEYNCIYRSALLAPSPDHASLTLEALVGGKLYQSYSALIVPPGILS